MVVLNVFRWETAKPSIMQLSRDGHFVGPRVDCVGEQAQQAQQATDTEDDEDEDYDPYENRAETWQRKI